MPQPELPEPRAAAAAMPRALPALGLAIALLAVVPVGCSLAPPPPDPIVWVAPPLSPVTSKEARLPIGPELRLAAVRAAAHLGERIAWRADGVQLGFYETRRWAERPEAYLARALRAELFLRGGLREAQAGAVPSLEIDLAAFDELVAPKRAARIELTATLFDARGQAIWQGTQAIEKPVDGDDPRRLALAMGLALGEVARGLGPEVAGALRRARAGSSTSP